MISDMKPKEGLKASKLKFLINDQNGIMKLK